MRQKKNIIVFLKSLPSYSETFITSFVGHYTSYRGIYVGGPHSQQSIPPLCCKPAVVIKEEMRLTSPQNVFSIVTPVGYVKNPEWLKEVASYSPCLIHAHFGISGVLALPLARTLGIPFVVTFHGYDICIDDAQDQSDLYGSALGQKLYLQGRARIFKEAACCISTSEYIKSRLIEKGCHPDKADACKLGVDINEFYPDPSVRREPIVLFVGRFVDKKGWNYLIQAMACVQRRYPEIELVLIGDGPHYSEAQEQAAQSLKRYRFLGTQPQEVVKTWMNKAMLLCAPSVTDYRGNSEALLLVCLEAQSMKLPVVSTFHDGIPENVMHEKTGLLVPEKDVSALAEAMITFAGNPSLREEFGRRGREHIEERFNIEDKTRHLENIYDNILNTQRRR